MRFVLERLYDAAMSQPEYVLVKDGPISYLRLDGIVESIENQKDRVVIMLDKIDLETMEQAVKDMGMTYLRTFNKLTDGKTEPCLAVYTLPPEVETSTSEGILVNYTLKGHTHLYSPSLKVMVIMKDAYDAENNLDTELVNRYLRLMTDSRRNVPGNPRNFRN